jgi:hypothetical protein
MAMTPPTSSPVAQELTSSLDFVPAIQRVVAVTTIEPVSLPGITCTGDFCNYLGAMGDTLNDGVGYACTTQNCDGKGGMCTVACDNGGRLGGGGLARLSQRRTGEPDADDCCDGDGLE